MNPQAPAFRVLFQRSLLPVVAGSPIAGGQRWDGHVEGVHLLEVVLADDTTPGWVEMKEWRDGQYRAVWTHDLELAVLTYCEGGLLLECYETQEGYQGALVRAVQFYQDCR